MSVSGLGADPVEGLGAAPRAARHRARACRPSGPPPRWTRGRAAAGRARPRAVLLPLLDAATARPAAGTLETRGAARRRSSRAACAMRCTAACAHLQFGQVLLASVGSTAPFVGLFGTVWGIYHALRRHLGGRLDHHREGRRPGRRGADHDRRRPGGGDSGRAGLQRVRQVGRRLRGRARRLRARPARDGRRRAARAERLLRWLSAASNAAPARGR